MILPFATSRKRTSEATDEDSELLNALFVDAEGDSDPNDAEDDDDEQEVDPDREAFDERAIEEIIAEVEAEDALTPAENRLGKFAVTKVR